MSTFHNTTASMALAENVKKLRSREGISQTELADAIGVSYPRISEIERSVGNPTLLTIEKIAEFFGVSASDLLKRKKIRQIA